jgi:hypothetical protein
MPGSLHRLDLTVVAQQGNEIVVDATVFVPEVEEGAWNLPSFLGRVGCLERLRFLSLRFVRKDPLDCFDLLLFPILIGSTLGFETYGLGIFPERHNDKVDVFAQIDAEFLGALIHFIPVNRSRERLVLQLFLD